MIEVEKKFKLDKKQLARIIKLADFVSKKAFIDIYFDDEKRTLTCHDMWLRKRGQNFEFKVPVKFQQAGKRANVYREIYGRKKISARLKIKNEGSDFTKTLKKNGYSPFCKIKTIRQKYSYQRFTIDIDEMGFGYALCEIEKAASSPAKIMETEKAVLKLGHELGLRIKWKIRGKVLEYLWRYDKKHYNKLKESKVIL